MKRLLIWQSSERKRLFEASNKDYNVEDSNEESNHIEKYDDKCKTNKDSSLNLMSIVEISKLITNVVKT